MFNGRSWCFFCKENDTKIRYLRSYALNYVQHEVQAEQWVRNLDPFRKFLPIVAQTNSKILNYSNISKDVGVSSPTVLSYFEILEDSYIGFRLPAFHASIRKQQRLAPKFYLFDLGIKRALEKSLNGILSEGTSSYGEAFESFIVVEFYRLLSYFKPDAQMFYLQTKDGAEIDLIICESGKVDILIEIKSKKQVDERDVKSLIHFKKDFKNGHFILISQDTNSKKIDGILAVYWKTAFEVVIGL
jgi:uncharacterized protein